MRRLVIPAIVAIGLVALGPSGAFADDPAPTVSVKATPGKKMCKITDDKLDELSGIVVTKTGYIVINDSTTVDSHRRVFFLNTKCKVVNDVGFDGKPLDAEDIALSPDGKKLWIADIGDNNYNKPDSRRPHLALWSMPADGSGEAVRHRVAYPDGDFHDAEALLMNGDGTPLIVTKEVGKPTYVYQPTGALKTSETPVPMKRVAQLTLSPTETPGPPVARIGNRSVSGGAVAPGGGKVALRTYTDALEWDVKNGDVVAALQGRPRTTGLPNEAQGEAIAYSADGKTFLTVSDMSGNTEAENYILQYTPATTVATAKKASGADSDGKKWYSDLTIDDINYLVGGVGLLGLLLVGAGVLGIVQHRKRVGSSPPADDDDGDDGFKNPLEGEPETELIGVGGPVAGQRAGVYGGARSGPATPAAAAGAGVYGGPNGGGAPRGKGVYGSGGTPQYARPQGGAQPGQPPRPPGAGQPPRPAGGGQPARPSGAGQPARPSGAGQPARPSGAGQPPRPAGGGQPSRPVSGGQPPARPVSGGQPARPAGGGQARPPQGVPQRGGQQPPARGGQPPQRGGGPQPPQRGGQQPPARGGQQPPQRGGGPQPPQRGGQQPPRPPQRGGPQPPGRNGVYGGGQPQGQRPQGPGQGPRPPQGGQQPGRPDQGRQQSNADDYRRPDGRFDNPGPPRR